MVRTDAAKMRKMNPKLIVNKDIHYFPLPRPPVRTRMEPNNAKTKKRKRNKTVIFKKKGKEKGEKMDDVE